MHNSSHIRGGSRKPCIGNLAQRDVQLGAKFRGCVGIDSGMLHMAHDSHDLKRGLREAGSNRFPKRILPRKGFASQLFVNHSDLLVFFHLLGSEEPAFQEWNAHDVEMVTSNDVYIRKSYFVVRGRLIGAAESDSSIPPKGKSAHLDSRGFDTRQAAEPIMEFAKRLADAFGSRKFLW